MDTLYSNEEQQQQQQQQIQSNALDNEIEYNELLISEREAEIQNIEDGIVELNEIFRNMDLIVNEQESGIRKLFKDTFERISDYLLFLLNREYLWQHLERCAKYQTGCR